MEPEMKCAIKLNDFASFDRYLFGMKGPNWGLFYNKTDDLFTPPIEHPKTEVEYQLNHYTLWMVISHFHLRHKPRFSFAHQPRLKCYACGYKLRYGNRKNVRLSCAGYCPLAIWDTIEAESTPVSWICGEEYNTFIDCVYDNCDVPAISLAAKRVAKMLWRVIES